MEHTYLLHLRFILFSILLDGSLQYFNAYSIKIMSPTTNVSFANIEVWLLFFFLFILLSNTFTNVTSVNEEQGCSLTKLRIVGNNNKLIYFHVVDFLFLWNCRSYMHKVQGSRNFSKELNLVD